MTEDTFYRDKTVRASDRSEWMVSVSGPGQPIRARIGAGLEPIVDEPTVRVANSSGLNGNFRNIACLELPAELFGNARFRPRDAIEFASTFVGHCRAYRVEWKGRFSLSR